MAAGGEATRAFEGIFYNSFLVGERKTTSQNLASGF